MSNLHKPLRNLADFEVLPAPDYPKFLDAYCAGHNKALEDMHRRLQLKPRHKDYPDPSEQLAFEVWHMRMHDEIDRLRTVITAMHN